MSKTDKLVGAAAAAAIALATGCTSQDDRQCKQLPTVQLQQQCIQQDQYAARTGSGAGFIYLGHSYFGPYLRSQHGFGESGHGRGGFGG